MIHLFCRLSIPLWQKQEKTAHNERSLLNNAYLCTVLREMRARIASEALCFFHTENFDNSQEKMEKRVRSSLGIDFIGCVPLTSYKGVSCSSYLFSGS